MIVKGVGLQYFEIASYSGIVKGEMIYDYRTTSGKELHFDGQGV